MVWRLRLRTKYKAQRPNIFPAISNPYQRKKLPTFRMFRPNTFFILLPTSPQPRKMAMPSMQRKTKLHRSRSRPNPFRNNRTNKDPTLQKFARTTRPNRYNSRPHLQTTTRHPTTLRTRKTKRTRI